MRMPYENKSRKITYKQLQETTLALGTSAQIGFAGLSYGSKRNKKGEAVDPEEATLIQLKSWPAFRDALLEANLRNRGKNSPSIPRRWTARRLCIYRSIKPGRRAAPSLVRHATFAS